VTGVNRPSAQARLHAWREQHHVRRAGLL